MDLWYDQQQRKICCPTLSKKWYRTNRQPQSATVLKISGFATVQLVLQKRTNEWPAQGAICEVFAESEDSACNLASIFDQVKLFRSKACLSQL
jgi:hypothetical protein